MMVRNVWRLTKLQKIDRLYLAQACAIFGVVCVLLFNKLQREYSREIAKMLKSRPPVQ